jgi:Na+/H+-dicarboxylate symporter
LRFFLIAVLTREYGIESLKFLKKNIKWVLITVICLFVIYGVVWYIW